MILFTYAFFILFILYLIRIRPYKKKYKNSQYKYISGKCFLETVFNRGNLGEFLTFYMLERTGQKNILTNVYLPKKDGTTTEIDVLLINNTGIYVFESKNYSGWIFGNEKDKMWTQTLQGGKKQKFYNPIWQNKGHIIALDNYLNKQYTDCYYSYIIFSERCELKKVTSTSKNVIVVKRNHFIHELIKQMEYAPQRLSESEVEDIYLTLKERTLVDESIKQKHIEDIKGNIK